MNLDKNELDLIEAWARMAQPLSGVYYRSVEYRYMDPKTVLDGNGAATHGGRFASVGTKAVYLAESDSVASGEVTARKARLGGNAQISLDKYPRIVFSVAVTLKKVVDLSKKPLPKGMAAIRDKCMNAADLGASQELGDRLRTLGVEGMIFPSAVGVGKNLIVYKDLCAKDALQLQNLSALMRMLKKIARTR